MAVHSASSTDGIGGTHEAGVGAESIMWDELKAGDAV
jgi:hypothetical protein